MAIAFALGFTLFVLLVIAAMLRFVYRTVSMLVRYVFSRKAPESIE